MNFAISTDETSCTRIAIEGELDAASVSDLRADIEKLLVQQPDHVVVDLSCLRLVDSSGIGALVALYKGVKTTGGTVIVTGLRDQPLAIFRLLRLDQVMTGTHQAAPARKLAAGGH